VFYLDVTSALFGCCVFNERFDCSMQHKIDVAVVFFSPHQRIANDIFQYFFDVANGGSLCCRRFPSMF